MLPKSMMRRASPVGDGRIELRSSLFARIVAIFASPPRRRGPFAGDAGVTAPGGQCLVTKRALCVGINDYPQLAQGDLRGCVNDARAWANVLQHQFDVASTDITLLLDRAATKRRILLALDRLLTGAPGRCARVLHLVTWHVPR